MVGKANGVQDKEQGMNPFDCFEGGREGVLSRFVSMFQPKVIALSELERKEIAQHIEGRVAEDIWGRLAVGDSSVLVGNNAINVLVNVFWLNTNDGLGDPNFENEGEWLTAMHEHGFRSVSAPMPQENLVRLFVILEALRSLEDEVVG